MSARASQPICPECARYREYQEYVQPSSVLPDELSPYKSLLTRYADLVVENKELKALVKDLKNERSELVKRNVAAGLELKELYRSK
jgi:hypothetical protein